MTGGGRGESGEDDQVAGPPLLYPPPGREPLNPVEREIFIDKLLFRIHFIIEMIWGTGLAPWEFELPFPGSQTSSKSSALAHWDQGQVAGAELKPYILNLLPLKPQPSARNPKPETQNPKSEARSP